MSKPQKIHLQYVENGVWKVRWGNTYYTTNKLIIFIQLVSGESGELIGLGVVEPYGKDTLVLRTQ